jgi:hypothetical protein
MITIVYGPAIAEGAKRERDKRADKLSHHFGARRVLDQWSRYDDGADRVPRAGDLILTVEAPPYRIRDPHHSIHIERMRCFLWRRRGGHDF